LNSALHQLVRRTIRRHDLLPAGGRVLAAVSGGSDSVALLWLLLDLAEYGGFTVEAVAHFNHGLRPEAAADESFCRDLAQRAAVPYLTETADVRRFATSERLSIEDAARRLRYDFLDRAAVRCGAGHVAVGHTQDDQAETYLLKLIRGAGTAGLGGIYPRRGRVVRPLLDVTRANLRAYLTSRGEAWVEDATNADLENPRNRIRHAVLPELDRAYGGSTGPAIARAASLAREDSQWIDELSRNRMEQLAVHDDDESGRKRVQIDAGGLLAEPLPVRRRVLLMVMRSLAGGREVGLDHVHAGLDVLMGEALGADIPGSRLELRREKLVLVQQGAPAK
jgi:tRNA(Ile)-lysidine synthase